MTELRTMYGAIYVLENTTVKRVKVGVTNSSLQGRIIDISRKWEGINATCQICGGRRLLVNPKGLFPTHQVSGKRCPGSLKLPFEKDSKIACSYLKELRTQLAETIGNEKGAITRKIKALENKIKVYQDLENPVGEWKLKVVYFTNWAEHIELQSHELLFKYLDKKATFGEVFQCSVLEAERAIESIIEQNGLKSSARKETSESLAALGSYSFA